MYKVARTSLATLRRTASSEASGDFTEARQNQVMVHLDCVLQSPIFRNSKRVCALLRYVVERALEGQADQLKERTIGVEAFGRQADYDTSIDHSVRSAAGEVRRRLAQFYMEYGAESGVRIEILPGSYIPNIRFVNSLSTAEDIDPSVSLLQPAASPSVSDIHKSSRRSGWRGFRRAAVVGAAVILLLSGLAFRTAWHTQTPFDQLWNPIVASPGTALLCFGGGQSAASADPPTTLGDLERSRGRHMNVADALALAAVTGTLRSQGKSYRILDRANATSFKDLQQGPFILIGALNNEWTLRLQSGLRYTFAGEPGGRYIADRQNPGNTAWSFSYNSAVSQHVRDYAIVTRLLDPMTQQTGLIVAGIGSWGTQAAGEFVSSPVHIRKLESLGPRHWAQKNLQVVIATDIINGSSGPPVVLATYFW